MHMDANIKKRVINPIRRKFESVLRRGTVPLSWCAGSNWGDALSPILVQLLSGMQASYSTGSHSERLLAVGSILDSANEYAEVWGSGFVREGSTILGIPRRIHSVRGPKSRDRLISLGIPCPAVYGDPALLVPYFFPPAKKTRHIGIIPHYVDKHSKWIEQVRTEEFVKIIDVEADTKSFIHEVTSCSVILSSSLHGLICADAYQIPNVWITISEQIMGGFFKFQDYRLALDSMVLEPLAAKGSITAAELSREAVIHGRQFDRAPMISACPICPESMKLNLLRWANTELLSS